MRADLKKHIKEIKAKIERVRLSMKQMMSSILDTFSLTKNVIDQYAKCATSVRKVLIEVQEQAKSRTMIEFDPEMMNSAYIGLSEGNTLLRRKTDNTCAIICKPALTKDKKKHIWKMMLANSCDPGGFGICLKTIEDVKCCKNCDRITNNSGIGVAHKGLYKMSGNSDIHLKRIYTCTLDYKHHKFIIEGCGTHLTADIGDGPYYAYAEPCCSACVYCIIND